MKSLIKAVALTVALSAPLASFAQSSTQPLTRQQVRDDLLQVERMGYNPHTGQDPYYPADIQAAEARVAAQKRSTAASAEASVGGTSADVSASGNAGHTVTTPGMKSIYFGQ